MSREEYRNFRNVTIENLSAGKNLTGRQKIDEFRSFVKNNVSSILECNKNFNISDFKFFKNAILYWDTRLTGESRIEASQDPLCEVAFVIPIHNEKSERIIHQLKMFEKQKVDKGLFEIIYVINNDLPISGEGNQESIKANQKVITELIEYKKTSKLRIHIIDKSSPGSEIIDCNVGKARNRGIAEASLRFYENKKNGLLIQTDADSYFEDFSYLNKVLKSVKNNSKTIGIAGGIIYEVDPDSDNPQELDLLLSKLNKFNLLREWHFMGSFLKNPDSAYLFKDKTFSGAHMISKSFETALLGGLNDTKDAEDVEFGKKLNEYAESNGLEILGKREELFVVTAWRDSDRTGAGFKKTLNSIDHQKPIIERDSRAPYYKQVKEAMIVGLKKNMHNPDGIRKIFTSEKGELYISEKGLTSLIDFLSNRNIIDLSEPFYQEWSKNYMPGDSDPVKKEYDEKYPEFEITHEKIAELELEVLKHPKGAAFIRNMRNNLTKQRPKKYN